MARICFILCLCAIAAPRTFAAGPIKLQGLAEVHAEKSSGSGTTQLYLRNDSATPLAVVLSAAPPTPSGTSLASEPQVYFAAESDTGPGDPEYRFSLPPGRATKVKVSVIGAWGSFPVDMDLQNGGVSFAKLRVFPSPMNISLVEPAAEKPDLDLRDGVPARIILKNDDPVSYALSDRLIVADWQLAGIDFQMPAQSIIILEFVPTANPYVGWWSASMAHLQEVFKARVAEPGTLYLYQKQGASVDYSLPAKMIPLTASIAHFSPASRAALNYFLIVFILILGGVASLTIGHALPNSLEKLTIDEQLDELTRITSNLSSNIDSWLAVLIRLERGRLTELLKSRKTFSPDFATVLSQCQEGIARLQMRVDITQQLDVLIERRDNLAYAGAPPTQIDSVQQSLEQATAILSKAAPVEADMQDAQKLVTAAKASLDTINRPSSDCCKALYQKVQEVKKTIPDPKDNETFRDIARDVPGPLRALNAVPETPPEIDTAAYAAVDMALWKIQIMRDYAVFAEGNTISATKQRLKEEQPQMVSYLSLESWAELKAAKLLLREMKDDIYPKLLHDILVNNEASIKMEPAFAYEQEPLEFSVDFGTRLVNKAAAREEWTCTWKFGDGLQAQGWDISHYFLLTNSKRFRPRHAQTYDVTASFHDGDGKQVVETNAKTGTIDPIVVKGRFTVHPSKFRNWVSERTIAEVARLAVALLVAVFALVAGVKDQLAKLDVLPGLIAIFVAGYGVDVLKNLINSGKSSS